MKSFVISAATDAGVNIDGAKEGALKLGKYLENKNLEVIYINESKNFIKNKDPLNLRKNENEINKINENIYNEIIKKKNEFPLLIGGDHATSIGSILASNTIHDNIGIIWFDAHPDYNTFETTITGNIHGLPLATVTGFGNKDLAQFNQGKFVKKENTVIIGARSIDKKELENLKRAGIKIFTTEDIKKRGIKNICEEAIKIASCNTLGIHISYDLDIIDPTFAPGVSVKEDNGITYDEAIIGATLLVSDINKITSIDLVEFNPLNDISDKTYSLATKILDIMLEKISSKN